MMNNADAAFPPVHTKDGEELPLTNGSFVSLLQNSDRDVRKEAFENFYHTHEKHQNTSAALLASQVNQLKFFAGARKYTSTLEAALSVTNVPVSVYKNLIKTVHENMHYLHKYMGLRKKLLGVDELHMYDLYTPIVADVDVEISFEEAKKNVMAAVSVLGDDYQAILKEGFDNRWIDVYENVGKRSGAYSAGHKVHPFVLLITRTHWILNLRWPMKWDMPSIPICPIKINLHRMQNMSSLWQRWLPPATKRC